MPETELYMVGIASALPRDNFDRAVRDGVPRLTYAEHTDRSLDDPAMIWGYREKNKGTWRQLDPGDFLLFYVGDYEYRYVARIAATEHNYELGAALFETPDQVFEYVVYLSDCYEISIDSRELHQTYAGYDIGHPVRSQGFNDATYQAIAEAFDSVEDYIEAHRVDSQSDAAVVTDDDIATDGTAADIDRPQRVETQVSRVLRDTALVDDLKELYDYECQVCGAVRRRTPSTPYAEGHHIHPLGDSPPGPDDRSNILVLCPNHHADFDYGMVKVDPDTYATDHAYDPEISGKRLTVHSDHQLDSTHLEYHNEQIASFE